MSSHDLQTSSTRTTTNGVEILSTFSRTNDERALADWSVKKITFGNARNGTKVSVSSPLNEDFQDFGEKEGLTVRKGQSNVFGVLQLTSGDWRYLMETI